MRALLVTAATVAALAGLAGCGQDDPAAAPTTAEPPATGPEPTVATPAVPTKQPTGPDPVPPGTRPAPVPSAPVSLSPTGPVAPAGVTQVPSAQIDASGVPGYHDFRGLVWVYDDGHSLQMFASATSGCGAAEARLTSETVTEVRIDLRAMPQPQGGPADGEMCTTVITPRPVTVALDEPLGDRTIRLTGGR